MKKLFISLIALGAAASASAQADLFDNPDNEAYLGARISLDISSTADGNSYYSNGAGFSIGAIYNIPLYKNLYFEPGLSLFYDTFGEELLIPDENNMTYGSIDGSIRNLGFRIPLVAGYHFDFTDDMQLSVFTGPQLNLSVLAKEHLGDNSYSIFGEYGFKHIDLQWALGVGLSWQNYYVSVSGGIGMTKVRDWSTTDVYGKKVSDSFRRNNFSITLGYNF